MGLQTFHCLVLDTISFVGFGCEALRIKLIDCFILQCNDTHPKQTSDYVVRTCLLDVAAISDP